jgi:DnaJ-class molecular chaperone
MTKIDEARLYTSGTSSGPGHKGARLPKALDATAPMSAQCGKDQHRKCYVRDCSCPCHSALQAENHTIALAPYAVLLAKATDTDETIRALYHAIAKECHPDVVKTEEAAARWHAATEAYSAIKTLAARTDLLRRTALLAHRCSACECTGVIGSRSVKPGVRLCPACKGTGRT